MKVYLAGPLFSEAERGFLDACARTLRAAGFDCFVPHEHEAAALTARGVFELDCRKGLATANALVAWLDGPMVDDGTACEIGLFRGLMEEGAAWRKGILGLATDLRLRRRKVSFEHGGLNLFLAGAIESAGAVCWSVDEVVGRLSGWKGELEGP